jgi:histidinol-phosphate aminotransferase
MSKSKRHVLALRENLTGHSAGRSPAEAPRLVPFINMSLNENPFGPSPRVFEAIRKAALESNFYPDNLHLELKERLAWDAGLNPDQVLITAGSAAFLGIAAQTLLSPTSNAVTSVKSYNLYDVVTQAAGARLIQAPMRNDTFDLDAIRNELTAETRLVYISNPNNPTGTILEPEVIERFLDQLPEKITVVLDEAYSNFAEYFALERGIEYSKSFDFVRDGRNVLVLRTFSKAHGLAGLRIGYGFAPAALIERFTRKRMQFSVTNIASSAALAALDDTTHIQKTLVNNSQQAAWLTERVNELGLRVKPTWANFLYLEIGDDSDKLSARMRGRGVIIRPLSLWGAPGAIRVTIGAPAQNEKFIAALHKERSCCAR